MSDNSQDSEKSKTKYRDRPYLIGISGGSGGGKTSVANALHRCLGTDNCLLFSMDTYYKNLTPEQEKNLNDYNFDAPDALDLDLLSEHLSALMKWESIEMPTYDFATNSRKKETLHIKPNKFIIFEGILAFHDKRMRNLMDLKLFIDLDDDIRLSRRIYRDIISRGRKMQDVIDRYHKFVKPAYNNYIRPTKVYADIIIPRGGSNSIAIDLINYYLKFKLSHIFPENIQNLIIDKLSNYKKENNDKDDMDMEIRKELSDDDLILKKIVLAEIKKESVDLLKLEDIFDKNVCIVSEEEKNKFFSIFKNYLLSEKHQYFDLYLDIITKKINDQIQNNIIHFINNDFKGVASIINEKINAIKKEKKDETIQLFIYVPILYIYSDKLKTIVDYVKGKNEISVINIISVFLKREVYEKNQEKNKIVFKAIYCGSAIEKYKEFIEKGGYFSKMEGEYSNNLIFSENNFEGKLAQLIEMNKKF